MGFPSVNLPLQTSEIFITFLIFFFILQSPLVFFLLLGNTLENDFRTPPPPINFVHGSRMHHKDIIGRVAAVPCPLAFNSRGARPPSLP